VVRPLAERFDPDLIIRNGGSDPHYEDPLTDIRHSFADLHEISSEIGRICWNLDTPRLDLVLSGYGPGKVEGWKALIYGAFEAKYDPPPTIHDNGSRSDKADRIASRTIMSVVERNGL